MEVTLKGMPSAESRRCPGCFNPCFNGSDSKSMAETLDVDELTSFNPCFNGSDSKSSYFCKDDDKLHVSILVLMEVTLKVRGCFSRSCLESVSILVLMEVTLKG